MGVDCQIEERARENLSPERKRIDDMQLRFGWKYTVLIAVGVVVAGVALVQILCRDAGAGERAARGTGRVRLCAGWSGRFGRPVVGE